MGNVQGSRVDHDDLPAHLPSVAHGRRRPATLFPVVDSQKERSMFHHETVAIQHTIFVVVSTHINNRIGLLQDGAVEIL